MNRLDAHNVKITTRARYASLLKTHLMPHWAAAPLAAIDHSSAQKWVTGLSPKLSPATIGECHRLFSAILTAATRDRLIAVNPAKGVRLPKKRHEAGARPGAQLATCTGARWTSGVSQRGAERVQGDLADRHRQP
jgi:hypothetical protein